jgi:hypothetical protein
MDITLKLNELAEIYAAREAVNLMKQDLIDKVLTPEIKAQIAEIEAEFADNIRVVNGRAAALEAEVKTAVATNGASVKGDFLQAVYAKGRTSWDTKALEGFAAAHPEIEKFRKTGEPSVSIRKVG